MTVRTMGVIFVFAFVILSFIVVAIDIEHSDPYSIVPMCVYSIPVKRE